MKNNKFLKSSAILFSGEFITRFLGFIYIGPLYAINQYAGTVNAALMPSYSIILIISAFGIGSAMTQQFSRNLDDKKAFSTSFFDGLYFVLFSGIVMTLFMFLFADQLIAGQYHGDPNYQHLVNGLYILAISIIFYCINTLLKSSLIAQDDLKVVSFTYVSEQVIKIAIVFLGALYFYSFNESSNLYMIYCFTLSITISVISTTIIMLAHIIRQNSLSMLNYKQYVFKYKRVVAIISVGIVFFLNSLFMSGFTFVDNQIFGLLIELPGKQAAELSDIYFNNVMKLINLPIVLGSVFVTVMTRQITITREEHKFTTFNKILNLQLLYGMLAFVFFVSAGLIFYKIFWVGPSELGIEITTFTSLIIPFYLVRVIMSVYTILRSRGKSVIISVGIMFLLKIVADVLFVSVLGVYGYTIASIISIVGSSIYLYLANTDIYDFTSEDVIYKLVIVLKFILIGIIMNLFTIQVLFELIKVSDFILFIIDSIALLLITALFFIKDIKKILTLYLEEKNG